MTREERLELLKQIEKDIYVCSLESTFLEDAKSCAIHSAIEELEQEPKSEWQKDHEILKAYSDGANEALDRVRAEIEGLTYYCCEVHPRTVIEDVLKIIDKYKGESEG